MAGKFLTFIAVLYSVTQVQAQTRTWDGSNGNFWGGAGNWVEGSIPNSTTTVIFNNELGANPDYFIDLRLNRSVLGVELGGDNAFTFGNADDQLSLGSGGFTTSSPSSGNLEHVFGSILNPTANSTWNIASSADLRLTGNMNGTNVITKTGSGNLILDYTSAADFTGSHDFDGTYIIQNGEIQIETAAAIANETADYTLDGGALRLNSSVNFSDSKDFSVTSNNGTIFGGTINYRIDGDISGEGILTKRGTGRLTLIGDATNIGGFDIQAGTLRIGNSQTSGTVTGDLTTTGTGATIQFERSDDYTYSGQISGNLRVTQGGSGKLTLTGSNTYTASAGLGDGVLRAGNSNALGSNSVDCLGGTLEYADGINISNDLWLQNDTILSVLAGETATHSGQIYEPIGPSSHALTKAGAGTLKLTRTNSYSDGTTISAGTLQLGDGGTSGSITGDVTNNSALTFNRSDNVTFDGIISGTGDVTKAGTGDLTFNGANTYSGATTVSAGSLIIAEENVDALANSAVTVSSGTTLRLDDDRNRDTYVLGSLSGGGAFETDGANTEIGSKNSSTTFSGVISGPGSLTKTGLGTFTLTGSNTYTGGTTINFGTLQLGDGGDSGSITGDVTVNGTLAFNRSDNLTFAEIISGPGNVTKAGAGDLTFSGANTYSGVTIVSAGTLIISEGNSDALANSTVSVSSGATLLLDDNAIGDTYVLGSLTGDGTFDTDGGNAEVGGNNDITTFAGSIKAGSSSEIIDKVGTGTWTLTGSDHDVGELVLDEGALVLDGISGSFDQVRNSSSGTITIQNTTSAFNVSNLNNGSNIGSMLITGASTVVEASTELTNRNQLTIEDGANLIANDFRQGNTDATIVDEALLTIGRFSSTTSNQRGTIAISNPSGGTALTIGNADDSTFRGVIEDHTSGPGSVIKTGAGQLTLLGTQRYTGLTTIAAGTLLADNFSGSVSNTGGTFSPGESPATTTIGGSYTQQAGGTLLLEIGGTTAGTDYDVLSLGANSDLAGTITVQLINGFTPSVGDQFTVITSTATITDSGVSYNLPALSSGLGWTTTLSATSLVLKIGYRNDLEGFRAQYGLAEDGSDDALDWSGNGIANILYFAFGLGDPNTVDVDRSRLPAIENGSVFGDYSVSFVKPKADVGLNIDLNTTDDLTNGFVDIELLGTAYQPVQTETESLDDDYERVIEHFEFVTEDETRFYRIVVNESSQDL